MLGPGDVRRYQKAVSQAGTALIAGTGLTGAGATGRGAWALHILLGKGRALCAALSSPGNPNKAHHHMGFILNMMELIGHLAQFLA